jgi:hypothetical protein
MIERAVLRSNKPKKGLGVYLGFGKKKMRFLRPLSDRPSWMNYPDRGRRRQYKSVEFASFYMEFQNKAALREFVRLNCKS